jgi:hypothetical protein
MADAAHPHWGEWRRARAWPLAMGGTTTRPRSAMPLVGDGSGSPLPAAPRKQELHPVQHGGNRLQGVWRRRTSQEGELGGDGREVGQSRHHLPRGSRALAAGSGSLGSASSVAHGCEERVLAPPVSYAAMPALAHPPLGRGGAHKPLGDAANADGRCRALRVSVE